MEDHRVWNTCVIWLEAAVIFGGLVALAALGEYVCGLSW